MIKVIDNVFDETEVDFFYGNFRDNSSWTFTGGVNEMNWRKLHMILNKDNSIHKKLFKPCFNCCFLISFLYPDSNFLP